MLARQNLLMFIKAWVYLAKYRRPQAKGTNKAFKVQVGPISIAAPAQPASYHAVVFFSSCNQLWYTW